MLVNIGFVALGAVFGVLARFLFSRWMKKRWPMDFPLATLLINLSGSFLLGMLVGSGAGSQWQLLIGTGFMGSYTTFSTFKLENIELHLKQQHKVLIGYLCLSYAGGIVLAGVGLWLGHEMSAIR
ncbi:fluoride efflux transporter CrcB [Paenibacillus hunanensis]|uniref:fluoride efflux transporter CrcB n=1 Tax=Paenibacillus hunanensis TaxID=539262 RepID=UPI002A69BB45|nr:fluoride efflux transporter CrcB [Paenibacillus hunanensis]WPP42546.1 fluoride efflux transporter CrcB [Paenibacillus hunanensis]